MLLTLIMPLFMLVVFRFGAMNRHGIPSIPRRTPDMAFPAAAAYALLVLTNLAYNNFGGDAGGIQFFYASPVSFREIVLAKNFAHASILAIEVLVAWIAVSFLLRPPSLEVTVASLAGLLFAAPLNFAAGNLLSIYSPKKRDLLLLRPSERFPDHRADQPWSAAFRRRRGSRCFLDRAALWQPLDRDADSAGAGGDLAHRLTG